MNTDELIDELGRELRPVRRLSPPAQRAAAWLACGVAYMAAMATLAWIRRGTLGVETTAPYLLQQTSLALMGALAAFGAFASVVPGAGARVRALVVVPMAAMMAALLWGVSRDVQEWGTAGFWREADWSCVVSTTLGGVVLWSVASAMLRRGAVLQPRATAVLAGLASVSLANLEACLSRAHTFTATVIIWHGATFVVLTLALMALGPRALARRWPNPFRSAG